MVKFMGRDYPDWAAARESLLDTGAELDGATAEKIFTRATQSGRISFRRVVTALAPVIGGALCQ